MKRISLFLYCLVLATASAWAQNPFLPLWEFIPDGEPYVFEDPDCPGKYRVYIYGSHDSTIKEYCGYEQVTWSAPVEDLTDWRYEGVILCVTHDQFGNQLHESGRGDMLYAPDMTVRQEADGTKTYYLYPNDQENGRRGLVAKAKRPDGPFEVCNWSKTEAGKTDGILDFDPGVFIDDDGRVYGYWGFEGSWAAELDPVTMATVKEGTQPIKNLIPSSKQAGIERFFETSSIRKIEDKYVFIYSRVTTDGENGMPSTNYTLAYAYSDNPLGPFTYGGQIVDGRAVQKDPVTGSSTYTAHPAGNTHGSIFEANGQWWLVYHRQTGTSEFSRQAMAAPITVKVEKGKGGKVFISEAEYTSEGFRTEGLNPTERIPAALACYYTGPDGASASFPSFTFSGSYTMPTRMKQMPLVNNTSGSIVGYKYIDFSKLSKKKSTSLLFNIKPEGVDGTVKIVLDSPYDGKVIGTLALSNSMPQQQTELSIPVDIAKQKGKHALYFIFESGTKGKSMCEFYDFIFE